MIETNGVELWACKEIELTRKLHEAAERIPVAEEAAGAAILDEAPGESLDTLTRARAEVVAFEAAIRACRARRVEAVKNARVAKAAEVRQEIAALETESATIIDEVNTLLERMNVIQQSRFAPPAYDATTLAPLPRTYHLGIELEALRTRLAQLTGEVPQAGVVDFQAGAGAADALVLAVLKHESDGPNAQAVLDWYEAVLRQAKRDFGDMARRVRFVWRDGKIDVEQSYVQVFEAAQTTLGGVSGAAVQSILGSDQFHAAG
jgi:hypothetical protein